MSTQVSEQATVRAGASSTFGSTFQARALGRLQLGLYRSSVRYGLRRDLDVPFKNPEAKIPLQVRPMETNDLANLLPMDQMEGVERLEAARRLAYAKHYPNGCFVAIDQGNGSPCYMQWLFGAVDNRAIAQMGGFPELRDDEALLENAYTPPEYRGLGIMPAAMGLIAEKAADLGADYVITFVDQHNIASLKGCQRAGFMPDLLHHKVQLAFGIGSRDSFARLADDDPRRTARF